MGGFVNVLEPPVPFDRMVVKHQTSRWFVSSSIPEVLAAAVTAEAAELGAGVGRAVAAEVRQVDALHHEHLPTLLTRELRQLRLVHLLVVQVGDSRKIIEVFGKNI